MKKNNKYPLIITILSAVVIIQAVFIIVITRSVKKQPVARIKKPAVTAPFKGRIAIVLDDWGYNMNSMPILERIHYPLTMSVLPNLAYSKEVAEQLHRNKFQVILHLPMEPHEKLRLEKNTIINAMTPEQIKEIINRDLADIPYVAGVSNHMGSSATENKNTMLVILEELKHRKLYFLDSFVTSSSVCPGLAKEIKVKFAKRDVFLDNNLDKAYIKSQINKLKSIAASRGYAIGIGHDRKVTLEVLAEVMPEIEKEGYRFVFASDLTK